LNLSSSLTAAATVVAVGNITGGNIITAAAVSAASVSASGTVVATGNITGGNIAATNHTGTTVSVTGNVTGGNIVTAAAVSAASVSASGNITGGNVNTNTIAGTTVTIKSAGDLVLSATGNIDVGTRYISNLANPMQNQDAATKFYVDSVAQGLDAKASVHTATAYGVPLPAYTYNNGTGGIGATLTGQAVGNLVVDGDLILSNQRVLVKNETGAFVNNTTMSAAFNGIYLCTTQGNATTAFVLTRSVDFDAPAEMYSAFTFVETGSTTADTGWVCTNNAASPITVGTTQIVFTQFSGAGQYTANNAAGLDLNGTVFSAKVDNVTTAFDGAGNIVVKTSAQLTTPNIGAATGSSLSVTGNVTSGNINTGGLSLSGNVLSTINSVSAVNTTANILGGNLNTGGLISATGNVSGGNVTAVTGMYVAGVSVLTVNATVDGGTY
jgi:hypothetical protein